MSNGTLWTPEQKGVIFDQVSRVMELGREGLREQPEVSRALQAIIGDDDIVVVPKVAQSPDGKVFHVTSDVKIRTAADAIAATGCEVKWGLAETPEKIPMVIQPADCRARLVELGKATTVEEIYTSFPRVVSPGEYFAFGGKFPEEQKAGPIVEVWLDAQGQFCCAFLSVYGGERYVDVRRGRPVGKFNGGCRVLVRE